MKTKLLLMIAADAGSAELVTRACAKTSHRILRAHTAREAFGIFQHGLTNIDMIVIDLAGGVHGTTVMEEMDIDASTPPIIALTDPSEPYLSGLAAVRGAAASIEKPFTVEELTSMLNEVSRSGWRAEAHTCDTWGHPHVCSTGLFPCPGCHHLKMKPPTALERANV